VSGCRGERENHTRRRSPKAHSQGLSRCSAGIVQGIGILFCRQIEQAAECHYAQQDISQLAAHCRSFPRGWTKDSTASQDFRHTFAVHTLTAWLNQRRDLRRMLPPPFLLYLGMGQTLASTGTLVSNGDRGRFRPQISALLGVLENPFAYKVDQASKQRKPRRLTIDLSNSDLSSRPALDRINEIACFCRPARDSKLDTPIAGCKLVSLDQLHN